MADKATDKLAKHRAILDQQWEGFVDSLRKLGPTAFAISESVDAASTRKFLELAKIGPPLTKGGKKLLHAAANIALSEGIARLMEKIGPGSEAQP